MASVTVGDISQEAIDNFWRQKDYISSRSHQKGLNYALEGYINNFIVEKVDEKLQLQQKFTGHSVNVINRISLPSPSQTTR